MEVKRLIIFYMSKYTIRINIINKKNNKFLNKAYFKQIKYKKI